MKSPHASDLTPKQSQNRTISVDVLNTSRSSAAPVLGTTHTDPCIHVGVKFPKLMDLVRSTLERVEQSEGESPHKQAAVSKLRRSVVLTIAERELRESGGVNTADAETADIQTATPEDTAA